MGVQEQSLRETGGSGNLVGAYKYLLDLDDVSCFEAIYSAEKLLVKEVEGGNVEVINGVFESQVRPVLTEYAKRSPTSSKYYEYLAVVSVVLLARAAIDGGAGSMIALAIQEYFLQKVSCIRFENQHKEFERLIRVAATVFANMVHDMKSIPNCSATVRQITSFISNNLTSKISIADIAAAVSDTSEHVSRCFRKEAGTSLKRYMQKEKLRFASSLLKYTEYPIASIAAYLGYASQSYFGEQFRREYKLTPAEFRAKYAFNLT